MSKIVEVCKQIAWKGGTPRSKYAYKGGSPTSAYKQAYRKYFGKYSRLKASRCDLSVALVARMACGAKMPKGNQEQLKWKPKRMRYKAYHNVRPIDVCKHGYICVYQKKNGRHSIVYTQNGLYQAQYRKTFFHYLRSHKKLQPKRSKVVVFYEK